MTPIIVYLIKLTHYKTFYHSEESNLYSLDQLPEVNRFTVKKSTAFGISDITSIRKKAKSLRFP